MSKHYETQITCPKCGKEAPFRIWESINTTLDPEMKEKVKDRSAFLFTCPNCGDANYVDYGFLYHQMEDTIMIAYSNSDENEEEMYHLFTEEIETPLGLDNIFLKDEYLVRIVRSLNALREKIYIFDDGLDDRIVEIYKLFIYVKILDDVPDTDGLNVFYMGGEHPHFEAVAKQKFIGSSDFNQGFYDSLVKKYSDQIPELRHDDPIVNRNYAIKLFHSKDNKE